MRSDRSYPLARLPWAGLLAVVALLALDRAAFGLHQTWATLSERDPFGVATPQLALHDLRHTPKEGPRALVVGPSRVFEGFSVQLAREQLPEVTIAKVAHPRFDPFVVRALVPELLATRPDVVAFVWSELDTNRPLRLEPVPGSSAASLGAVWDLLRDTGWRFAVDNRRTVYRLVGTSALEGYRYRTALFQAGLDDTRRFALHARLKPRRYLPQIFGDIVLWEAAPNPVTDAQRRDIVASFGPGVDPRFTNLSIDFVTEITPGSHAALQRSFIERTAELLRAAGVGVVIVEGPLHPRAAEIYDTALRSEFLAFMRHLEREQGVHFTPLEAMPPFPARDFKDLLHTSGSGTLKLTKGISESIRAGLPRSH